MLLKNFTILANKIKVFQTKLYIFREFYLIEYSQQNEIEVRPQDLLKEGYIGNLSQLVTARRLVISEGTAKGCEIIEVKTAGGLEVDILLDTGLDLGQCRYRGINMSWLSKNGYDSPSKILPYENEFVNTFPGGLLYTCGLRSAGPANRDNGEWHPLHGRYHGLAAEHVSVDIRNAEIIVQGEIKETALFGHLLQVKRVIRLSIWELPSKWRIKSVTLLLGMKNL